MVGFWLGRSAEMRHQRLQRGPSDCRRASLLYHHIIEYYIVLNYPIYIYIMNLYYVSILLHDVHAIYCSYTSVTYTSIPDTCDKGRHSDSIDAQDVELHGYWRSTSAWRVRIVSWRDSALDAPPGSHPKESPKGGWSLVWSEKMRMGSSLYQV